MIFSGSCCCIQSPEIEARELASRTPSGGYVGDLGANLSGLCVEVVVKDHRRGERLKAPGSRQK